MPFCRIADRHVALVSIVLLLAPASVRAADSDADNRIDHLVVTERNPDSVRGADVSFYSFIRVPRGRLPRGYLAVSPEVVIEVRSDSDRWSKLVNKATEYLDAGVSVVCLLDPDQNSIYVIRADQPPLRLGPDDELTVPELHDSFRERVGRFFE